MLLSIVSYCTPFMGNIILLCITKVKYNNMKKWTLAFLCITLFYAMAHAQQATPFKDANNKWGVKNNGIVVVTPQYDYVDVFFEGKAIVMLGTKFGTIDATGKVVIPIGRYTLVNPFSEGLASVSLNKKYGFVDASGKEIITPQYDFAGSFKDGLASVELNGKAGFINKAGKVVIPYKYGYCRIFSEGLSVVGINGVWDEQDYVQGKWGVIDKTGKELVPPKYDYIGYFAGGVAEVNIGGMWEYNEYDEPTVYGGKWGAIDKTGKEIVPLKYDYLITGSYSQYGYMVVEANKKYGVVNAAGVQLTPIKYDFIKPSSNEPGIAVVNIGGKYDELFGELIFNPYSGGSQGFVNFKTGKEITPVQYANVGDFYEGLAMVNIGAVYTQDAGYTGGKWGYINNTGQTIIPLKFDSADYFFDGKAKVKLDGREFYIDKTGKEVK